LSAIERLLEPFEPIPINDAVARVHALVWSELEQSGSVIGGHDLWIGATALTHGLGVATRNPRDFERIPGLRVLAA
jgi:tRNA(fMet)-specific endonuclease VapC